MNVTARVLHFGVVAAEHGSAPPEPNGSAAPAIGVSMTLLAPAEDGTAPAGTVLAVTVQVLRLAAAAWIHVYTTPNLSPAPPAMGPVSCAVPRPSMPPTFSSESLLLDVPTAGNDASPQALFARGLSSRLARRMARAQPAAAGSGNDAAPAVPLLTLNVCCGIGLGTGGMALPGIGEEGQLRPERVLGSEMVFTTAVTDAAWQLLTAPTTVPGASS